MAKDKTKMTIPEFVAAWEKYKAPKKGTPDEKWKHFVDYIHKAEKAAKCTCNTLEKNINIRLKVIANKYDLAGYILPMDTPHRPVADPVGQDSIADMLENGTLKAKKKPKKEEA